MILSGAMRLAGPIGPFVLVLILSETLISFGWMLYVGQRIFFGVPVVVAQGAPNVPWAMNATLIVLMIGCVAAPFVGMPLVQLMGR